MHSIESPTAGQRFASTISWICIVLSTGAMVQKKERKMCKNNIAADDKRILPHRLGQLAESDCLLLVSYGHSNG